MMKNTLLFIFIINLIAACASSSNSIDEDDFDKSENLQKECICMEIYEPVCGTDKNDYANSCLADCAGVSSRPGECWRYQK